MALKAFAKEWNVSPPLTSHWPKQIHGQLMYLWGGTQNFLQEGVTGRCRKKFRTFLQYNLPFLCYKTWNGLGHCCFTSVGVFTHHFENLIKSTEFIPRKMYPHTKLSPEICTNTNTYKSLHKISRVRDT